MAQRWRRGGVSRPKTPRRGWIRCRSTCEVVPFAASKRMILDDVRAFLLAEFPQVFAVQDLAVVAAGDGRATLRLMPDAQHLRPGGIVSGPTFMMLADAGAYAALLSLGSGAKMAVTSNLNVTFLRAGRAGEAIRLEAEVIKPGRRLSTVVAEAFGPAGDRLAHATMTYAMPA